MTALLGPLAVYLAVLAGVAGICRWLGRGLDRTSLAIVAILPLVFLAHGFTHNVTPVPTDHIRAYWTPWRGSSAPAPHNGTLSDFATQFVPWAKAVRLAWKEHSLPFLDRWNGCGTSLAANGVSAAFSPFTFLMFSLPLARAFVLLGAAKLLLSLTGTWLWLAELGLSKPAARFGAVCFGLSFALTSWLYHPASAGISLWPWLLFLVEYRDPPSWSRGWCCLVLLFAVWPLCGHLETVALGTLFIGLWLALRALGHDLQRPAHAVGRAALAGLTGLGLSAFLLVPQAHAILASNRLALANDPRHLDYVPWVPYRPGWLGALDTSLYPRTFGDDVAAPMIAGAAGSIVEMGFGYIGLVGWAFALLLPRPARSRPKENALTVILLCCLGAAMGLGVFRIALDSVPGLRLAPPLRLLLLVSLSGAALAAFAMDRLVRDATGRKIQIRSLLIRMAALLAVGAVLLGHLRRLHEAVGGFSPQLHAFAWNLAVGAAVALVCAGSLGRWITSPGLLAALFTLIAAVQLLHEGSRLYGFYPPATVYPETPLLAYLRTQPGSFRVVGEGSAIFPNTNVFPGLEEIRTHDPIERRDYVEFLDRTCGYAPSEYFKRLRNLDAPALDFLNVRFLIADPGAEAPGTKWRRVYAGFDGTVFENEAVLARIFAPPVVQVVAPTAGSASQPVNALAAFGSPFSDYLAAGSFHDRAFVLSDRPAGPRPGLGLVHQNAAAVRIGSIRETTNNVEFEAAAEDTTILVSSIVDDGGWSGADDRGRPVRLCLVNGPFLGIFFPAGPHTVILKYRPPGLSIGVAVTAATAALALLAGLALVLRARRRFP